MFVKLYSSTQKHAVYYPVSLVIWVHDYWVYVSQKFVSLDDYHIFFIRDLCSCNCFVFTYDRCSFV